MTPFVVITTMLLGHQSWSGNSKLDSPTGPPTFVYYEADDTNQSAANRAASHDVSLDAPRTVRTALPAAPLTGSPRFPVTRRPERSKEVRRTSASQVMDVQQIERSVASPFSVLTAALRPRERATFAGVETSMLHLLKEVQGRAERLEIVLAYWDLVLKIARHYYAIDEVGELAVISLASRADTSLLRAAQATAEARRRKTRLNAVQAQHELVVKAGLSYHGRSSRLPVPTEAPLVGPYATKFDVVFARRSPPPQARRIHNTLDLSRQVIEANAASIVLTFRSYNESKHRYERGQAVMEDLLRIHDQLHRGRVEFLFSVLRYNQDIADYALVAASEKVSRERIAAMLLPRRKGFAEQATSRHARAAALNGPVVNGSPGSGLRRVPRHELIELQPIPRDNGTVDHE